MIFQGVALKVAMHTKRIFSYLKNYLFLHQKSLPNNITNVLKKQHQ
jgi:hypothetical protein